jgi:hypothetical protein
MVATGDPTLRLKILRNRADGFRKRSMAGRSLQICFHVATIVEARGTDRERVVRVKP